MALVNRTYTDLALKKFNTIIFKIRYLEALIEFFRVSLVLKENHHK